MGHKNKLSLRYHPASERADVLLNFHGLDQLGEGYK